MDSYRQAIGLWKSDLTDKIKCIFFQATVVSIMLYGCITRTLTKRMEKKLGDNYRRMLRTISNMSCRQLYGHLPPITRTIQVRRTRYPGHCWAPSHGQAKIGWPARSYIQQLYADTKRSLEDLVEAMNDSDGWWERVREIRAGSATRWWWWWCLLSVQGFYCYLLKQ